MEKNQKCMEAEPSLLFRKKNWYLGSKITQKQVLKYVVLSNFAWFIDIVLLVFPAIEGVGSYSVSSSNFPNLKIWSKYKWFYILIEAVAQRCSVKKGVLRNFTKLIGKHLCQSLFFNKGLQFF